MKFTGERFIPGAVGRIITASKPERVVSKYQELLQKQYN